MGKAFGTNKRELHTKLWVETLKAKHHLGPLGIDKRMILKPISEKQGIQVWTGFIWLNTHSSGRSL
jgi:hypothetical protein